MVSDNMKIVAEYISNNTKTWLELLGYPHYNETVVGKDIVRETGIDEKNFTIEYKILWSFESNAQAKQSLISWYNEWESFCNNKENYK